MNDARGVILAINRQPGTTRWKWWNNVRRLLPSFSGSFAFGAAGGGLRRVAIHSQLDPRRGVHAAAHRRHRDFGHFPVSRNISATLIPGAAVPFSIVGTFAVMYLLGYSLNYLSLMALTLSVGFVVDGRHRDAGEYRASHGDGETRMHAAVTAAREIGFTIVSMTISLVAVFIPVLFLAAWWAACCTSFR